MHGLAALPIRVVAETTWPVEGIQDLSLTPELLKETLNIKISNDVCI